MAENQTEGWYNNAELTMANFIVISALVGALDDEERRRFCIILRSRLPVRETEHLSQQISLSNLNALLSTILESSLSKQTET